MPRAGSLEHSFTQGGLSFIHPLMRRDDCPEQEPITPQKKRGLNIYSQNTLLGMLVLCLLSKQPEFFIAWILQDAGNIPLRFLVDGDMIASHNFLQLAQVHFYAANLF